MTVHDDGVTPWSQHDVVSLSKVHSSSSHRTSTCMKRLPLISLEQAAAAAAAGGGVEDGSMSPSDVDDDVRH